jgi:phosphoribosylanthranilate isomerase
MSQKPLIYVSRITNLSDARYCAGMGADMLGFSVDPSNPDYVNPIAYQEMVGWIVGPKRVIEITLSQPVELEKIIDQYKPELLHVTYSDIKSYASDLPAVLEISFKDWLAHGDKLHLHGINIEYVLLTEFPEGVTQEEIVKGPYPVLLAIDKDTSDVTYMLDKTGGSGFALQGTREDAPGLKDYDHLSRILEELDEDES